MKWAQHNKLSHRMFFRECLCVAYVRIHHYRQKYPMPSSYDFMACHHQSFLRYKLFMTISWIFLVMAILIRYQNKQRSIIVITYCVVLYYSQKFGSKCNRNKAALDLSYKFMKLEYSQTKNRFFIDFDSIRM